MSLETTKKIASRVFDCGVTRVKIVKGDEAKDALTADDVRELVKTGAVMIVPVKGVGRGKARRKQSRKAAGRRRGEGSRKGAAYSRTSAKSLWMRKVRAQRKVLKMIKSSIKSGSYRKVYRMIKGNLFRSKKQLTQYLEENNLLIKKVDEK